MSRATQGSEFKPRGFCFDSFFRVKKKRSPDRVVDFVAVSCAHAACLFVCLFVCVFVCLFVCMYVCMFVCLFVGWFGLVWFGLVLFWLSLVLV